MRTLTNQSDLPNLYAHAWRTHDIEVLKEIFSEDVVYQIQGKKEINGIGALIKYWERNKGRQKSIVVHPLVKVSESEGAMNCVFCSRFRDVEEKEDQLVYGSIDFKTKGGKISAVYENYHVDRQRVGTETPIPLDRESSRFLKKLWVNSVEVVLQRFTTPITVLIAILLGYAAFNLSNLSDFVLCALNFQWDSCAIKTVSERNELTLSVARRISMLVSGLIVLTPFLFLFRYNYFNPVKRARLYERDDDIELMLKHYKGADHITVFSGSFQFVSSNAQVLQKFVDLNRRDALRLISSKREAEVRAALTTSSEGTALLEDLVRNRRIIFESKAPIKCSILQTWDGAEVLYKDRMTSKDGPSYEEMCVLKGKREIFHPVELIRKVARALHS